MKILLFIINFTLATLYSSCISSDGRDKKQASSGDLKLQVPSKTFTLNLQGNDLYALIGKKLNSDTMKNAITQLGTYSFSTSMDEYYPYPTTAEYLTYDYDGIILQIIGSGMNIERNELQKTFEEFPNSFWLEYIAIYPDKFKKKLPYGLKANSKPGEVDSLLGEHDEFFSSQSTLSYFEYIYPNKGIDIRFTTHFSDTVISQIILRDSITVMKRFPTKFGSKDSIK